MEDQQAPSTALPDAPASAPIIAMQPGAVMEVAPMFMLVKARQLDQAIKSAQELQQAMMHGFAFGRGINLATHKILLDTDKGTITISPIQSEQPK